MTVDDDRERRKVELLGKLFDLRTFIGALFLLFGVVVTVEGIFATPADIAKAGNWNVSLWLGMSMVLVGAFFVTWMLLKPPALVPEQPELLAEQDFDPT